MEKWKVVTVLFSPRPLRERVTEGRVRGKGKGEGRGGFTTSPGSEAEGGEDADVLELCESYICGVGVNMSLLGGDVTK